MNEKTPLSVYIAALVGSLLGLYASWFGTGLLFSGLFKRIVIFVLIGAEVGIFAGGLLCSTVVLLIHFVGGLL